VIKTSTMKKSKIISYLRSIRSVDKWDYIFVRDINNTPCVTTRKHEIKETLGLINEEKIIVVVKEIESSNMVLVSLIGVGHYKA